MRLGSTAALAAISIALAPAGAQAAVGAGYVATDNVEFLATLPASGGGIGARIVDETLFVTSPAGIQTYDISTPESPRLLGTVKVDVHWQNEDVPTNGKVLGLSADTACPASVNISCLRLYDVRDPAAPVFLRTVGGGDHTSACILDCSYMWGSGGTVTDLTRIFEPGNRAPIVGNWHASVPGAGYCHATREITPGIILGACQPVMLFSVRPEDGGSPTHPVVLARGGNADGRLIHTARWPRDGADSFGLIGGETNAQPTCDDDVGAFMTWDFTRAHTDGRLRMIDEWRPRQGAYFDGGSAHHGLGCTIHWFAEHHSFNEGGLVAVAAYDDGTHLVEVDPDGSIREVGWYLPIGGSASAPHWAPDSDVFYSVDYQRGVDVLRWHGADRGNPTVGTGPALRRSDPVGRAAVEAASATSRRHALLCYLGQGA